MKRGFAALGKEKENLMDITGIGSIFDFAKGVMDKIWPPEADPNQRVQAQLRLQEMMEVRENTVIEAQRAVIVAEMSQGDNYTKRARPTIVYAGLAFILAVHVAFPIIVFFTGRPMPTLSLPEEFWWAWTGVCGIWVFGRSMEKRGSSNKIIDMITGNK